MQPLHSLDDIPVSGTLQYFVLALSSLEIPGAEKSLARPTS